MNPFDWFKKADGESGPSSSVDPAAERPSAEALRESVIDMLRTVYDPEIPVNIYDLGLIYDLTADPADGDVHIDMTLTAPGCPVAQTFPGTVEDAVRKVPGVNQVQVELVWEPPWTRDRMSEAARLELGMF
jgi:FeS assembly SUF system protein